jgi:O-methyltransferase involved in polyketide biosynthesis
MLYTLEPFWIIGAASCCEALSAVFNSFHIPSTLTSERISSTAHYTGFVWYRNDDSDEAFSSWQGWALYWLIRLARLTPWLEDWLLARHRLIDHRLTSAIESGEITQVIEIAAGLSPRGWRFHKRYGDRITYVETDLVGMVERKRRLLLKLGGASSHLRTVELDILSEGGANTLEALCSTLDPSQGTAIISEGLLLYLEKPVVHAIWRRVSMALRGFPHGRYFADVSPLEWPNTTSLYLFGGLLSGLVRGRIFLHFASSAEVAEELARCGLTGNVLDPACFSEQLGVDRRAAAHGRVIDAQVAE